MGFRVGRQSFLMNLDMLRLSKVEITVENNADVDVHDSYTTSSAICIYLKYVCYFSIRVGKMYYNAFLSVIIRTVENMEKTSLLSYSKAWKWEFNVCKFKKNINCFRFAKPLALP